MSRDIADFLRARYAEARELATDATPGSWTVDDPNTRWGDDLDHRLVGGGKILCTLNSEHSGPLNADFIAANSPAVVLADLDAKEQILRELPGPDWHESCASLVWLILALLAQVYSDHPDYREEWRP